jgi:ABC-type multidrug transport system permease subunit
MCFFLSFSFLNRYGLFFLTSMLLALGGFAEMPIVTAQRDVMHKHHDAGFFPPSVYVLAQSIVSIPLNMVQTGLFGTIMWWMCGLTDSNNGLRYGEFVIISFILSVTVSQVREHAQVNLPFCIFAITYLFFFLHIFEHTQILRFVGSIAPDVETGSPIAGCFIIFFILFSGFIIQVCMSPLGTKIYLSRFWIFVFSSCCNFARNRSKLTLLWFWFLL